MSCRPTGRLISSADVKQLSDEIRARIDQEGDDAWRETLDVIVWTSCMVCMAAGLVAEPPLGLGLLACAAVVSVARWLSL